MSDKDFRTLMYVLIVLIMMVFVTIIVADVSNRVIKIACIEKGNDFITYSEMGINIYYCGDISKVINLIEGVKKIGE